MINKLFVIVYNLFTTVYNLFTIRKYKKKNLEKGHVDKLNKKLTQSIIIQKNEHEI